MFLIHRSIELVSITSNCVPPFPISTPLWNLPHLSSTLKVLHLTRSIFSLYFLATLFLLLTLLPAHLIVTYAPLTPHFFLQNPCLLIHKILLLSCILLSVLSILLEVWLLLLLALDFSFHIVFKS